MEKKKQTFYDILVREVKERKLRMVPLADLRSWQTREGQPDSNKSKVRELLKDILDGKIK